MYKYIKNSFKNYDYSTVLVVPDIPLKDRQRFDFKDLVNIVEILRGDNGCPWDRVQTRESLKKTLIEEAYELNLPPSYKGKRLKIYFSNQVSTCPPTFNIQVNNKGLVHFSYERYLENKIRENFDFEGTPIVIQFKNKGEQES